eukprot:1069397-Pelagomonas_calceolata.AAC.3
MPGRCIAALLQCASWRYAADTWMAFRLSKEASRRQDATSSRTSWTVCGGPFAAEQAYDTLLSHGWRLGCPMRHSEGKRPMQPGKMRPARKSRHSEGKRPMQPGKRHLEGKRPMQPGKVRPACMCMHVHVCVRHSDGKKPMQPGKVRPARMCMYCIEGFGAT